MNALTISGYGALFNSETTIAGAFREVIRPGAFSETIARDDVRSLFNHGTDNVLGRVRAHTLELSEDKRGLHYVTSINPDDPAAMAVVARIRRGDVSGSSFWFAVAGADGEEWQAGSRGQLPLRILHTLTLVDVGPVAFPAYTLTSAVVRDVSADVARREAIRRQIDAARRLKV